MHRTEGNGYVVVGGKHQFTAGDPLIPVPATMLTYDWCNAVQEELCALVEGLGGTVATLATDGTPNQVLTVLNAKYGRLDLANTWAGNQSIGGSLAVTSTSTFTGLVTTNGGHVGNGVTTGAGLTGNGGPTNGTGVVGTGAGTGAGVSGTGGGTSGAGGSFTGGASNGTGVVATGTGSGVGVQSTGGFTSTVALPASGTVLSLNHYTMHSGSYPSTSGNNYPLFAFRYAPSTNLAALSVRVYNTGTVASWSDTQVRLSMDVDSSPGIGGQLAFGSGGLKAIGPVAAIAGTPANALSLTNGYLSLDGVTAPSSNVAIKNTLTPANICKAWAIVSNTAGTVSLVDGFNVAGVANNGSGTLVVTLATGAGMASGTYAVVGNAGANGWVYGSSQTATTFQAIVTVGSGAKSLASYTDTITIFVMGRQ